MSHLTIDEIIEFVSMDELNEGTLKLSATVNGHIRKCDQCFKIVRSFQLIRDEFLRLGNDSDFKAHLYKEMKNNKNAQVMRETLELERQSAEQDADLEG